MRCPNRLMGLIVVAVLVAGCCPCSQNIETRVAPAAAGDQCEGWGTERIWDGRVGPAEELRCNGDCPDGTPCRPIYNADSTRQWCGCPGEPEPGQCHLVRTLDTSFQWYYSCSRPCPDPADRCLLQRHVLPEDTTRTRVTCECIFPGDDD